MNDNFYLTIQSEEKTTRMKANPGKTLLSHLQEGGFAVDAPCGGNGTCGMCKVTVTGTVCRMSAGPNTHAAQSSVSATDASTVSFQEEEIAACQYFPCSDVTILLPRTSGERILTDRISLPAGGNGYGLAVDIGTTTVAAFLYDLDTGECLVSKGEMNAQRTYGADVISRIRYASEEEGLPVLTRVIREQIRKLAQSLCPDLSKITQISIAGNTVMEHLFSGLSPESIGVAPFTPQSLFGDESPANLYWDAFAPDTSVYIAPAISGYVGGDITAGIVSSGALQSKTPTLFIDIGTNGEMALGSKDGFWCCATAAGPAFEGAGIECGSPARDGAISLVHPDLSFEVLGQKEAKSICGSGIIDAVAALLENQIIDETGHMEEERFTLSDSVYISQKDIRQIQLAKAAIRGGIETLLSLCQKDYDGISQVLIAGGFGAYMRLSSAAAIGLLPPALAKKARYVGNSAGKGAALALTPAGKEQLKEAAARMRYEELSSSPVFNDYYIDAMLFEE